MKSSLKKLRGFTLHKGDSKEKRDHRPPAAHLDELAQASQASSLLPVSKSQIKRFHRLKGFTYKQVVPCPSKLKFRAAYTYSNIKDMQDMKNCYDGLLSAAAATANSAYEFSESLREMGACLLEKTALNDDEESGRVLLMLGKVQFELRKLVDSYRSHIFQTITTPSESLLNELRTVEDMKRQCDEKRNLYEHMMAAQREKGRSRIAKTEIFSSQQLQTAQEEYDDEATLFVFRLKSLKRGQSRSLLTQAARHHSAQLSFFKKGLRSLEAVEPHVKLVAEQQHIDYQFSGLEDDDAVDGYDDDEHDDDDDEEDDDDGGYEANDDGELSFDYGQNDHGQEVLSTSRHSMELDPMDHSLAPTSTSETSQENSDKSQVDLHAWKRKPRLGSQSAPIFADKKFDPLEKLREMRPSSTRKFNAYVLPTPVDSKYPILPGSSNEIPGMRQTSISKDTKNIWHSSPLEPKKHVKESILNAESVLKESNINSSSTQVPPPLAEGLSLRRFDPSDTKKIKRQAFSGPLTSKPFSSKPIISSSGPIAIVEHPQLPRVPISHPSVSPKVSPSASPSFIPSPKISELHQLPRPPPATLAKPRRPSGSIGHSAPLASRSQELSTTNILPSTASPLPTPPGTVSRSFSIPSSSQRAMSIHVGKISEAPRDPDNPEEVDSPPLRPISLPNIQPTLTVVEDGKNSVVRYRWK